MPNDVTQERIRSVLSGVLAPLARTLLRCGVSYSEFADLSKRAFVEAASADYGVRNRPTNIARVAVMTGLSRKEVSRIRRLVATKKKVLQVLRNLPAEVLHRWHTDSQFLDSLGRPKPLMLSGKKCSFSQLARLVSTDTPPMALYRELLRAGALRHLRSKQVLPNSREFVPGSANDKLIEGLQFGLCRLIETISYNAIPENAKELRFQRVTHVGGILEKDLPLVRDSIAAILASFTTRIDDYLTSLESSRVGQVKKGNLHDVGVGLYYFESSLADNKGK